MIMSKNWDYAEQSRRAKEAGGPEAYANQLEKRGYDLGYLDGDEENAPKHQLEGALALASIFVVYKGVSLGYHKIADYFENKKRQRQIIEEDIEVQKRELIESLDDQDSDLDIYTESVNNDSDSEEPDNSDSEEPDDSDGERGNEISSDIEN